MSEKTWTDLGVYEQGRVDAAVVDSLFGQSDDRGWLDTYTAVICWIKTASLLAGHNEASISAIAKLLRNEQGLMALLDEVAGTAASDRDKAAAEEFYDWLADDWLIRDESFRTAVADHLDIIAESNLRVTRHKNPTTSQVAIGDRTGPWSYWNTTLLPAHLQAIIKTATRTGPAGASA